MDFLKRIWTAWRAGDERQAGLLAAGIAFYAFLALVPFLGALVLLYGVVADPTRAVQDSGRLFELMPPGAARVIGDQMRAVADGDGAGGLLGFLAALGLALFGAMKGAKAIIVALNRVVDADERGLVGQNRVALGITALLVGNGLASLAALGLLSSLDFLIGDAGPLFLVLAQLAGWTTLALISLVALILVYRYAPHTPYPPWSSHVPGALLAAAGFILASIAFAIYVSTLGNFNATYGALGAVVVLLLWLFLSARMLLLGAAFNRARREGTRDVLAD